MCVRSTLDRLFGTDASRREGFREKWRRVSPGVVVVEGGVWKKFKLFHETMLIRSCVGVWMDEWTLNQNKINDECEWWRRSSKWIVSPDSLFQHAATISLSSSFDVVSRGSGRDGQPPPIIQIPTPPNHPHTTTTTPHARHRTMRHHRAYMTFRCLVVVTLILCVSCCVVVCFCFLLLLFFCFSFVGFLVESTDQTKGDATKERKPTQEEEQKRRRRHNTKQVFTSTTKNVYRQYRDKDRDGDSSSSLLPLRSLFCSLVGVVVRRSVERRPIRADDPIDRSRPDNNATKTTTTNTNQHSNIHTTQYRMVSNNVCGLYG